ncbi:MAG: flagellar M-ring protein FliF [Cellvibrionales bacterium]|jgi:flagellar M-ring protein FliF|nr:flagellar M-ring protein FliF [Cellvibrionales bacterium]
MAESTATDPAVMETSSPGTFESFLNLEFGRQIGLMFGLAASVAIGVALALWLMVDKDFKPLYASLEQLDSTSIIEILDSNRINYRIDNRSGALLVDADQIHQARLSLASAGMPADRNMGFELLDQEQPLGTSQFMENARYRRSLEGELARTISSIGAVRSARVHLAIPKSTVFLRDKREPRASVFIEAYQGRTVSDEQVRAVANLVVSSVPELNIRNVTVVDQRGNLLSDFDSDPKYAEAARQIEYTRQIESDLLQRVNGLLAPIVGDQKFRAEVSIDLDFTQIEQTAEVYNPDLSAVRSEQTTSERTQQADGSTGVPGALSNQPPLTGNTSARVDPITGKAVPEPTRSRVLETRNFELDRTISYTRNAVGQVRRMTVAVAVDDLLARAEDSATEGVEGAGESEAAPTLRNGKLPWDASDLERLTVLVQNAVGYDVTRGDRVIVVNTPFLRIDPEIEAPMALKLWEQDVFWLGLKWFLGVAAFLMVIFMVLRPTLNRLTENSQKIKELEGRHKAALHAVMENSDGLTETVGPDGKVTLNSPNKNLLPSPDDRLEDQIDMVRNMVSDDPDRVAQVIQGWSNSE